MSGPKLVGVGLLVVLLGVWVTRTFVFDDADTGHSVDTPTVPVPTADDDDQPATTLPAPVDEVVAVDDLAGVPVGYPRSDRGAATAAVNWVASFPTIIRMGPIRLDDTLNRLLSARTASSGSDAVVSDYFALFDELGPRFGERVWIESPLQVEVIEFDSSSAQIVVWSVLVTGDPGEGPIESVWRTHRIDVVWERDDWRIDEVSITEGPTPIPNEIALPSPAADFVRVDGWQPAVFVDTTAWED